MENRPVCPICNESFTCWCAKHERWECHNDPNFKEDLDEQTHVIGNGVLENGNR